MLKRFKRKSKENKEKKGNNLQHKIITGLCIYLGIAFIIGGGYAYQNYRADSAKADNIQNSEDAWDTAFLNDLLLELEAINETADHSDSNTLNDPYPYDKELELYRSNDLIEQILNQSSNSGKLSGELNSALPDNMNSGSIKSGNTNSTPQTGTNKENGTDSMGSFAPEAKPVVTEAELQELQSKVSVTDRIKALNILRKRLSAADIKQIISWAQGGVTSEEKQKMKELLLSRLSAEEIQEVKVLYEKYN